MSKQRALELCDSVDVILVDGTAKQLIALLSGAIRELAKEESYPTTKATYSESVMKICDAVNQAAVAGNISDKTVFSIYKVLGYKPFDKTTPSSSSCGGVP